MSSWTADAWFLNVDFTMKTGELNGDLSDVSSELAIWKKGEMEIWSAQSDITEQFEFDQQKVVWLQSMAIFSRKSRLEMALNGVVIMRA